MECRGEIAHKFSKKAEKNKIKIKSLPFSKFSRICSDSSRAHYVGAENERN